MSLTLGQQQAFERLLKIVAAHELTPRERRSLAWATAMMKDERPSKNVPLRVIEGGRNRYGFGVGASA
jgi:hypothetical protein